MLKPSRNSLVFPLFHTPLQIPRGTVQRNFMYTLNELQHKFYCTPQWVFLILQSVVIDNCNKLMK